jgi:flagellar basal-body rod protein FlgG
MMNAAFEIGAVSLRAQQRALEVQANNVANINTPGFKRSEVQFAEVVSTLPDPVTESERIARSPASQSGGVRAETRVMMGDYGELQTTNSPMDLGIDGAGFIELLGPDGESHLWRGGRLEVDKDGYLAAQGLSALRALITVPDDATAIEIASDGLVRVQLDDGESLEIGQIGLVRPASDADLVPIGDGRFKLTEGARMTDSAPGEDGSGLLRQGMIELSNVEMTQAMVDMLVLQRAYAASAQVIQTADQIATITNNLSR